MEDGTYIVKDGAAYKITPKINIPFAKSVNVMTGEIYYPSNADRIRSMTDKELAQFLSNLSANGCDYAKCPARHGCEAFSVKTCKEQMENWLKQEVDKQ